MTHLLAAKSPVAAGERSDDHVLSDLMHGPCTPDFPRGAQRTPSGVGVSDDQDAVLSNMMRGVVPAGQAASTLPDSGPPSFGKDDRRDGVVLSRLMRDDDARLNGLLGGDPVVVGREQQPGKEPQDDAALHALLASGGSPTEAVLAKIHALKAEREEELRDAAALDLMMGSGSHLGLPPTSPSTGRIPTIRRIRAIKFRATDVKPGTLPYFAFIGDVPSSRHLCETAQSGHDRFLGNATDIHGRTALHYAAWQGSLEIIGLLLDARADVQSKDDEGRTALHVACFRGHEGAVRLLLGTALHRLRTSALRHFRDLRAHFFGEIGNSGVAAQLAAIDALVEYLRSLEDMRCNLLGMKDTHHHTCFHYAVRDSFGGCLAVLQLLFSSLCEYGDPHEMDRLMLDTRFHGQPGVSVTDWLGLYIPAQQVLAIQDEHIRRSGAISEDLVTVRDDHGLTLLHYAAAGGNHRAVPLLVAFRADPEAQASLPQAGVVQDGEVAQLVGICPRDVAADVATRTALFAAMAHGGHRLESQAACAINQVELNSVSANRECGLMARTPLHLVIFEAIAGSSEAPPPNLKRLLDAHRECDPLQPDASGWSPVHYACAYGRVEELRELLEHEKSFRSFLNAKRLSRKDKKAGNRTMARVPSQHAAREAALGRTRGTQSTSAAHRTKARSPTSSSASTKLHMEALTGRTPTHISAQGAVDGTRPGTAHLGCLAVLHHYGLLELEAVDDGGHTPLHSACISGSASAAGWLLQMGADCARVNKMKENALHLAVAKGHRQAMRLLVEYDADNSTLKQMKDWKGRRPVDRMSSTQSLSLSAGEDYTTPWEAARKGDIDELKMSFRRSMHVDCLSPAGWTAAMYASKEGHIDILRLLLSMRCMSDAPTLASEATLKGEAANARPSSFRRPTARPTKGCGPLHLAAAGGHVEVCDLLVSIGSAKLEKRSDNGKTPLMWACAAGHLAATQQLVRLGADAVADVDSAQPSKNVFHLLAAGNSEEHAKCIHWLASHLDPYLVLDLLERSYEKMQILPPLESAAMRSHTYHAITRAQKDARRRCSAPLVDSEVGEVGLAADPQRSWNG
mmetsp:Transcript_57603/g.106471  ORF Transcript_57603/g.106471 Transcript_57603/m.106471 type:complete len:1081 (+) Transcript_57603:107-3349(+)